jgi:SPP1 family predicted phage head-tail adaptor
MTLSKAVTAMQLVSKGMRDKTATIIKPTFSSDGMGGRIATWEVVTTCSCRLSPVISTSDEEKVTGERQKSIQVFRIFIPHTITVEGDYRIIIDDQQFEIIQIIPPQSYMVEIQLLCNKASDICDL